MNLQEMYTSTTESGLSEAYYIYELIEKPSIEKIKRLKERWGKN